MSSGRTHDRINTIVTLSLLMGGLAKGDINIVSCSVGLAIGTFWLSPDLDLPRSNPSSRLGVVKLLFKPYRLLCGHHRSWVSHSPLLSTMIRFVYTFTPLIALAVVSGHQDIVKMIITNNLFLWFYLGLEISTDIHLFLDWQYSFRKRLQL